MPQLTYANRNCFWSLETKFRKPPKSGPPHRQGVHRARRTFRCRDFEVLLHPRPSGFRKMLRPNLQLLHFRGDVAVAAFGD